MEVGPKDAVTTARLYHHGKLMAQWRNPLPGEHMAYNAAAAAVLARRVGAAWEGIVGAIETFEGLDRRMQLIGRRAIPGSGGTAAGHREGGR